MGAASSASTRPPTLSSAVPARQRAVSTARPSLVSSRLAALLALARSGPAPRASRTTLPAQAAPSRLSLKREHVSSCPLRLSSLHVPCQPFFSFVSLLHSL